MLGTPRNADPWSTENKVLVLMKNQPQRSRSEVLRIHRPFAVGSWRKKLPSKNDLLRQLQCTDFSKTDNVSAQACHDLLMPIEADYVDSSYAPVMARVPVRPMNRSACRKGTALIYPLHGRDENVCHLLMKFLFGFSVSKRALLTPRWMNIPPVQTVIILAPRSLMPVFMNRNSFHIGLLKALFTQHGVKVVIRPTLESLEAKYRCHAAGVFVGSYSNRFAHPDAILGENSTYFGASPLPFPLSSDGLALREHIFKANPMPRRRYKVLYVTRQAGRRRTWTRASDSKMRYMLWRVAKRNGAELDIFEGDPSAGFMTQIRHFADATVIIGFHGAGLALAAFAPRGSKIIEIEPEYHFLSIFRRLESSGLLHQVVRLSEGTSDGSQRTSRLIPKDEMVIESALDSSLQAIGKPE